MLGSILFYIDGSLEKIIVLSIYGELMIAVLFSLYLNATVCLQESMFKPCPVSRLVGMAPLC